MSTRKQGSLRTNGDLGCLLWSLLLAIFSLPTYFCAQGTVGAERTLEPVKREFTEAETRALSQWVTQVARQAIPHEYEDTRRWGMTRQRWNGLDLHLEGLHLKTKRRHKEVNHGLWSRFHVELLHPKRDFQIDIRHVGTTPNGELAMQLDLTSPVRVTGRLAKWNYGLQVMSASVEATAKVQLRVSTHVKLELDFSRTPPDFVLAPEISRAELVLLEFETHRLSKLSGEVAEQLGKSSRIFIDHKIEKENERLAGKLNRSIAKHKDDLRFSMQEFMSSQWSKILPSDPQNVRDEEVMDQGAPSLNP